MEEKRLAAFECMLVDICRRHEETVDKMASLKAQGREKSATYRQLLGNKMTLQNMLSLYKLYDLLDDSRKGGTSDG